MPDLPTGTLTFLFTDIEGSTRLWEQYPEAMEQAHARHGQLIADCVVRHHGTLIRERGEGDSTFSVFSLATEALAAICCIQRALQVERWPTNTPLWVRAALHTGTAGVREDDYNSSDVNRCARLRAIAHGGQTLLSQSTFALVQNALPEGISLKDMGRHRLKDLQRPEQVYQLLHPDLRADFLPLKSLDALQTNLPQQLTSFVGRQREMQEVRATLQTTRLLTLTGAGGCGKTRLALQVAAELLDDYPDGVWLVELAALADPSLVPQALAVALGVREEPGHPLGDTLSDYLQPKTLLLLLDNCEHLVEACAQLTDALLKTCPHLRILATSRESLGITGETARRVPSLSLPDLQQRPSVETWVRSEAMRLFVERAVAVKSSFVLTDANAPAAAQLCHRLDGIPLAIELAAARVKALPVEEIAARLEDRFRLLTGGSRTALPRQRTLQALIDWSYDLLSASEQHLFRRLSVFAGSFSLEAAEAVCGGAGLEAEEVLDLLTSLVAKSLVLDEEHDGTARFRLLETIRQYAQDKLLAAGEAEQVREWHFDLFWQWVLQAEGKLKGNLKGREQAAWYDRFEAEHDNVRAALAWGNTDPESKEKALQLASALWPFWNVRGYLSEGRKWLAGARETSQNVSPQVRAKAMHGAGTLAFAQGDFAAARSLLEESLRLFRQLGDKAQTAATLSTLGAIGYYQNQFGAADALLKESLSLRRELADQAGIADVLVWLGNIAYGEDDYSKASRFFEESLAIYRQLQHELNMAHVLTNLAVMAHEQEQYVGACSLYQESLAIYRELGFKANSATVLNNLGNVLREQGDYAAARPLLEESLAIQRALQNMPDIALSLNTLGLLYCAQGDHKAAHACFAESVDLYRELKDSAGLAYAVTGLADVARGQRQSERAARILGAVEALREALSIALTHSDGRDWARSVAAVRSSLDESAFSAAWTIGRALSLEQAITEAPSETSTF